MSKERLEAIRHYYREMESFDPGTQSDINWLIEQAEKAEKYREALEFYADDKSWEFDWLDDIRESLIWQDYGEKARKALEG